MPRRARRVGAALVGLILAGEVVLLVLRSHQLDHPATSAPVGASPTVTYRSNPTPTVTSTIPPSTVPVTSTTVSPPVPVTATSSTVTYKLPAGTPVTISARGPCYVEVRRDATGPVIDARTMNAGDTKTYTSPVWIRLGDTSQVSVVAGSTALTVPAIAPGDLIIASS
jgi:hypothetical protein